jgi:hemolysin III
MPHQTVPFLFRDPVSAASHLLWCVLGVYVTGMLWRLARGDRRRQWSVGCFGLSVVLLYGASGLYHAVRGGPALVETLRLLDHSAIYVLIAGTYTPVFAVLLEGRMRTALLALVWGLAGIGIACKWVLELLHHQPPYPVTVALYIALGWVGLVPAYHLIRAVGWRAMGVGLCGGLLYTAGGICDALRWPVLLPGVVGYHEVLHVLDMGGTLTHVVFVIRYVLPFRR